MISDTRIRKNLSDEFFTSGSIAISNTLQLTDMILTPSGFIPELNFQEHSESAIHLFHRDAYINWGPMPRQLLWEDLASLGLHPSRFHSLGTWNGVKHVAVALADDFDPTALPMDMQAGGLRQWFGRVDDAQMAVAMRAVQILEWDRTHRFCGHCGTPTTLTPGERARTCPACKLTAYPRISPAMMVLVTHEDHLLLARGTNFPPGRFSALAGFVEAGESLEECVAREVFEEVGVQVGQPEYFASQSWPFPNSLMIAFRAPWTGGEIQVDPAEIAEAHWYRFDQLPQLPPRVSVSRFLIDDTVKRMRERYGS